MNFYKLKTLIFVFILSCAYAVIRYNVFGNVSVQNIPVYIINKSISLSSVIFLFLAAWNFWKKNIEASKSWGTYSLHFAFVHGIISLMILSDTYFPKFFEQGKMNLNGELSMLFGGIAAYLYIIIRRNNFNKKGFLTLKIYASMAIALHLFFMGYKGWVKVGDWLGGMPQISLISFVVVVGGLGMYLKSRED